MNAPNLLPRRSRAQLLLLAVLFLGPFLAAYLLYFYFPALHPSGRVNYGTLITPARPIPPGLSFTRPDGSTVGDDLLRGHWSLVYLGSGNCDAACAQHLYMTRQVRTRLRGDAERVQRIYVAQNPGALATVRAALAPQHKDVVWVAEAGDSGARLADFLHPDDPAAVYLFDPHGNWLLVYGEAQNREPPNTYMSHLYADLSKLLRLSSIG
jgi:hypothetical protein